MSDTATEASCKNINGNLRRVKTMLKRKTTQRSSRACALPFSNNISGIERRIEMAGVVIHYMDRLRADVRKTVKDIDQF